MLYGAELVLRPPEIISRVATAISSEFAAAWKADDDKGGKPERCETNCADNSLMRIEVG